MAELSTYTKASVVVLIILAIVSVVIPNGSGVREATDITKALSNARQIGLACKNYADDHGGNFPPSLDALFPTYLDPGSRFLLASKFNPGEPMGYIYTPPKPGNPAPANPIIIEDKFAPQVKHVRIVVHADDSAQVLHVP